MVPDVAFLVEVRVGVPDPDPEDDQQSAADDLDKVELAFDEIRNGGNAE
ncbi:hypothetical protein QW131_02215 [Roseibium salinum]|nr:hypothetical protein [Roseibium salinum]